MKRPSPKLAAVSIIALAAALPAAAQEFSFGTALEYGEGTFGTEFLGSINDRGSDSYRLFKLIGDVKYPLGQRGFYVGGDLSLGFAIGGTDNFGNSSGGSLDQLHRARLLGGFRTGDLDLYAATGYAIAKGDFYPGSDNEASTFEGRTLALGMGYSVNDKFDVGIEIIHDDMETTDGEKVAEWKNRAISANATYKF
ncbi:MAG: outer membrane beta-barrel protein [Vannielia sp.]|uniref:outer membrane beta-barrel protein n=1 Tax=Vannielia sp. TaxID=2813045 RepID=UPI003B8CC5B9